MMWRIMQIKEVLSSSLFEISVILHIKQKLNPIVVVLFIPNILTSKYAFNFLWKVSFFKTVAFSSAVYEYIFEEYEGMSINLAPVAQKVDSAIQWIKGVRLVSLILIHWIVIY